MKRLQRQERDYTVFEIQAGIDSAETTKERRKMKKSVIPLIIINIFILFNTKILSEPLNKADSLNSILYENVINYIRNDSSLKSELNRYNIKEICVSNSLVYLDNRFFLKELIDYNFPTTDSNEKNEIYQFTTFLILGCESIEFKNYYKNFGTNDNCKAILFITEMHNIYIRADVEIIPKYKTEWDYSTIAFNSDITYSYLFFLKDNKIEEVFLKKVIK